MEWGDANANCHIRRFCHVSKFPAPDSLHYDAVKSLRTTGPLTLFPKSTSSTSIKSPLQADNSIFVWRGHGQKVLIRMHQNTPFQVKKLIFLRGRAPSQAFPLIEKDTPLPHLLDWPLRAPELQPDLRRCWDTAVKQVRACGTGEINLIQVSVASRRRRQVRTTK